MPRIWGGSRLKEAFGWEGDEFLGEAWLAYDENQIARGALQGRPLKEAVQAFGRRLLGDWVLRRYGLELPLLVKYLDAGTWLSVQVHPNDAFAHQVEAATGFHGKNEAWVILDAEPGAKIVYGVRQEVSPEAFEKAAREGKVERYLNYVPVTPGDVIYIPAGTIHAMGPGILAYEVQQRSDLTYRIYDYGRGRPLHLEKALKVAQLKPTPVQKGRVDRDVFLRTPFFTLSKAESKACAPRDRFSILTRTDTLEPSVLLPPGTCFGPLPGQWIAASL